jgi:fatty acyl-CoA reductase
MECKSKIAEFYEDETVFITGATGFLGKAIVEKVLRVCRPRRLYILIRSKKGSTPEERKEALFNQPVSILQVFNSSLGILIMFKVDIFFPRPLID